MKFASEEIKTLILKICWLGRTNFAFPYFYARTVLIPFL